MILIELLAIQACPIQLYMLFSSNFNSNVQNIDFNFRCILLIDSYCFTENNSDPFFLLDTCISLCHLHLFIYE